jgi:hypothetical protein
MNSHNQFSTKLAAVIMSLSLALLIASYSNANAATGSAPQTQSAAKPNLAGQWKLNKDQSDDPRQKMQQAMGNSGQGGGEGGGGRHGGMRSGGQGGMMSDMSQLSIVQTDTSIKVSNASGRVLAAFPEDQQAAKPSSNPDDDAHQYAPPAANWQGSQLVTSMQGRRGGSTNRTYELSPDGKQLIVTTKMQNPRFSQPVSFRLVYDPAKASSSE